MSVNYDQGRASEPTIAGQSSASGALPASGLRLARWIVLVGLMGAGKSAVGRRVAHRLNVPFVDADAEIELAAGESINDIFAREGEAAFRTGERKVIARLLAATPPGVLATGGGAFMDEGTRGRIRAYGLSVWLRADLDTLFQRTSRRHNRPLLAVADPRARLAQLMAERHPIYQQAEVAVDSRPGPVDHTVDAVTEALARLAGPDGVVGAPPVGEIEAGRR